MTEINHIPDVEEQAAGVDLAHRLNSMLAAELGHQDDPENALALMLNALEARAQLPQAQASLAAAEAELSTLRVKVPQLEASLAESHRFEMMLARESGKENRDEIAGVLLAAITTQRDVLPELNALYKVQAKELETACALVKLWEPVMVEFSLALGCGHDVDEIHKVAREALEARKERQVTQLRLAEIERERSLEKLEARIVKARNEHRLTPFVENSVRQGFNSGRLSFESVDFMLDTLPVIPAFEHKHPAVPERSHHEAPLLYNNMTWSEMKPAERADLKREDPQLYNEMRRQALKEG